MWAHVRVEESPWGPQNRGVHTFTQAFPAWAPWKDEEAGETPEKALV